MLCPNCGKNLIEDVIDDQNIFHCSNCGGTFFQENGINRISVKSAEKIAMDLKNNQVLDGDKLCPLDNNLMIPLQTGENIPNNVSLLHCLKCKSVYANPNDLVIFKKAQLAKIDYFKIWNIPLPSIRSVAVLSVILFVSVLSLTAYSLLQRQNLYSIQAQDQIKNLYLTSSNRYLLISFKTLYPFRSKIIFRNLTTQTTTEKNISEEAKTLHILTTGDINLDEEIYFQIVLTDKNGNESRSEMRKLEIK